MVKRYFGKTIFDFTPGSGTFAAVAITNRIGYYGFALTEAHRDHLFKRLQTYVMQAMITEAISHTFVGKFLQGASHPAAGKEWVAKLSGPKH